MNITVRVGDLGKVITGNTPPRSNPELYGNYIPFIKATDISENEKYTYTPEEYYSEEGFRKYKTSLIPKHSTCVVTIGSIGKKMTMACQDCFINQAMNAIIPNNDYDYEYVYYLLKNNIHKLKNLDSGTASGRENVSKSAFMGMELSVIKDKVTQKRIGSILSAYDDLIENNQKQVKLLEEAAQRLYKEWFVDLRFPGHEGVKIVDGVPEGWESCKLRDVAEINGRNIGENYPYDKINYIDIGSVRNGRILEKANYNLEEAPGRAKRIVQDGDVIWGMVRPNLRAYAMVLNPDKNDVFSTGFAVLTSKKVPFSFLYCNVTTEEFVGYLVNCTNGAAYPAVKPIHFEEYNVSIPQNNLLNKFHNITEPYFRKIYYLNKQISSLREARDRLLPKLMSGEIEV